LVHGSSPCGPTKQESRALRGFFVSGVKRLNQVLPSHDQTCQILGKLVTSLRHQAQRRNQGMSMHRTENDREQ